MSQTSENAAQCIVCEQTTMTVPLTAFEYQGATFWICPQHLPILIHKPAQLTGKLTGAEGLAGAAGHHDH